MTNKIKVIEWESDSNSADGVPTYRLDDAEDAKRFFRDLLNNAETDGRETFTINELTQSEWDECVRNGEELS